MNDKKVLIVENVTEEEPGLIEKILKGYNIKYDIIDLDKGKSFPKPKDYSAVFVLGGPDSANDKTLKMQAELKRIKEIVDSNIPYFGICLGMQALVKACGGAVVKNQIKEAGLRD